MLASDDAVGATYRIVFENCDVTYSGCGQLQKRASVNTSCCCGVSCDALQKHAQPTTAASPGVSPA